MKWWRRNGQDAKQIREEAERELKQTKKMTPLIKAYAEALDLTEDEFAARIRAAFGRRA